MQPEHALLTHLGCFTIYFFMLYMSNGSGNKIFYQTDKPVINFGRLIGLHLNGILWLGLVPALISSQTATGILFGNNSDSVGQYIAIALLMATTVALLRGGTLTTIAPLVDNLSRLKLYVTVRIFFIISCELWFRGYLLWDATAAIGAPLAIGLTITLHSLVHAFSSTKAIHASIPFGFILCALTLWTQATWPAVIMHLLFFLVHEFQPLFGPCKPVKQTL